MILEIHFFKWKSIWRQWKMGGGVDWRQKSAKLWICGGKGSDEFVMPSSAGRSMNGPGTLDGGQWSVRSDQSDHRAVWSVGRQRVGHPGVVSGGGSVGGVAGGGGRRIVAGGVGAGEGGQRGWPPVGAMGGGLGPVGGARGVEPKKWGRHVWSILCLRTNSHKFLQKSSKFSFNDLMLCVL